MKLRPHHANMRQLADVMFPAELRTPGQEYPRELDDVDAEQVRLLSDFDTWKAAANNGDSTTGLTISESATAERSAVGQQISVLVDLVSKRFPEIDAHSKERRLQQDVVAPRTITVATPTQPPLPTVPPPVTPPPEVVQAATAALAAIPTLPPAQELASEAATAPYFYKNPDGTKAGMSSAYKCIRHSVTELNPSAGTSCVSQMVTSATDSVGSLVGVKDSDAPMMMLTTAVPLAVMATGPQRAVSEDVALEAQPEKLQDQLSTPVVS